MERLAQNHAVLCDLLKPGRVNSEDDKFWESGSERGEPGTDAAGIALTGAAPPSCTSAHTLLPAA